MRIVIRILRATLLASVFLGLAGCKTVFDKFDKSILEGMESSEIERVLKEHEIHYRYLTCNELQEELSNIKQGCTVEESIGAYVGWVNNGAYMLGMGSTDVYFEVQIGKNKKVVEVYTDEIYTFM
jgi:hypothetical protein